jgi:hypothetical protein
MAQVTNTPGGLDGLRGVWLALLILRMVITSQLTTKKSKIRTLDHSLTTIDPQNQRFEHTTMNYYTTIDHKKVKDSNPRPCTTTPPLSKISQIFELMTMHYITIDPKIQRLESTTMHYTTIDHKIQRFEPTAMHYTTIATKKSEIRPQDHALHHH